MYKSCSIRREREPPGHTLGCPTKPPLDRNGVTTEKSICPPLHQQCCLYEPDVVHGSKRCRKSLLENQCLTSPWGCAPRKVKGYDNVQTLLWCRTLHGSPRMQTGRWGRGMHLTSTRACCGARVVQVHIERPTSCVLR